MFMGGKHEGTFVFPSPPAHEFSDVFCYPLVILPSICHELILAFSNIRGEIKQMFSIDNTNI